MFTDAYLGNIAIFAGTFAPRGWSFCDGTLLPISENDALYSLIGTTYGGDGITTFALPDLRGRVALHAGQGPGMASYELGDFGGVETVVALSANLPMHTHTYIGLTGAPVGATADGSLADPTGDVPAKTKNINSYNTAGTSKMALTNIHVNTVPAGGSTPLTVVSPVLAMNYIIAIAGIYPSRN